MKREILSFFYLLSVFSIFFSGHNFTFAQSCPSQTTYTSDTAVLVGEITENGGDPNIDAWFRWGRDTSLVNSTPYQSLYANNLPVRFCRTITNLTPCTTYYYQAWARNSAGTRSGEILSFTTACRVTSADIKANDSNGPIVVNFGSNVILSWTSVNASYCVASGDWSGTKAANGQETLIRLAVGNYRFSIKCYDSSGSNYVSDSVDVKISAVTPTVRTLPAVETL